LQALRGYNAEHGHFYNRALQPLLAYFLLLMLFRGARRPAIAATAAVIGILIALVAVRQVQVARNTAAHHRITILIWMCLFGSAPVFPLVP
jgi:hypothetical protein